MLDNNNIRLPDQITNAKVKRAADEYSRLRAELDSEHCRLSDLQQSRHQAEEDDRAAFAAAIRKGSADPGTAAVEAADRAIAASTRRLEALTVAVAESRRALVGTVEAEREEWQDQLNAKVAEAAAAFSAAVEALGASHQELAEAMMVSAWLRRFPTRSDLKPVSITSSVAAMTRPNGYAESWSAVLAALRDHAASVAATTEAPKVALLA